MASPDLQPSLSPSSPSSAPLQPYSCLLCKHRKVKCDRTTPCSNCRKLRAECVFRAPPPPRRKRKVDKMKEQSVYARLKRYEGLLRGMGVKIGDIDVQVEDSANQTQADVVMEDARWSFGDMVAGTGKLISEEGKSRYLEKYVMHYLVSSNKTLTI
jgi:hypothetical protein